MDDELLRNIAVAIEVPDGSECTVSSNESRRWSPFPPPSPPAARFTSCCSIALSDSILRQCTLPPTSILLVLVRVHVQGGGIRASTGMLLCTSETPPRALTVPLL